jgi:hypothetical protein
VTGAGSTAGDAITSASNTVAGAVKVP